MSDHEVPTTSAGDPFDNAISALQRWADAFEDLTIARERVHAAQAILELERDRALEAVRAGGGSVRIGLMSGTRIVIEDYRGSGLLVGERECSGGLCESEGPQRPGAKLTVPARHAQDRPLRMLSTDELMGLMRLQKLAGYLAERLASVVEALGELADRELAERDRNVELVREAR